MSEQRTFVSQITDRLSNPFFFSFILSWLFWNWEIVIGLVWYNGNNIGHYGYDSYEALIRDNSNVLVNYLAPTLTALLYTFLWPWCRNNIDSFIALKAKQNNQNLRKISLGSFIPIEKYYTLKDRLDQANKSVELLIEQEKNNVKESGVFQQRYNEQLEKSNKMQEQLDKWNHKNDRQNIKGEWILTLKDSSTTYIVTIENNRLYFSGDHYYQINYFGARIDANVSILALHKALVSENPLINLTGFHLFEVDESYNVMKQFYEESRIVSLERTIQNEK